VETSGESIWAEVQGFKDGAILLFPMSAAVGLLPGARVIATDRALRVPAGDELLGRVLDGLGRPIDDLGPLRASHEIELAGSAPAPLKRPRIREIMPTGIRAIDSLLTCGKGQRLGVFAGSGVGKSVLLGMVARHGAADVNVVALIGERGREVREFIERDLGPEGMSRTVVVAVTADQPPLLRLKGAELATRLAECFRDAGRDVMLLFDSVTRVAMALREIGLAVGEPPTTRGYTPGMYSYIPRLLERAGTHELGCISAFYTVLVEGDDLTDPVADAARASLDGHVVLSRDLAARNHFPAIDVLASVSRLMPDLVTEEHRNRAAKFRALLAAYRDQEDLINMGAYVKGSSPLVDKALETKPACDAFLRQWLDEGADMNDSLVQLSELTGS
jgi:FliI/YscN family ATPase